MKSQRVRELEDAISKIHKRMYARAQYDLQDKAQLQILTKALQDEKKKKGWNFHI